MDGDIALEDRIQRDRGGYIFHRPRPCGRAGRGRRGGKHWV